MQTQTMEHLGGGAQAPGLWVLALIGVVVLGVALGTRRRNGTSEDYYQAGRDLPTWLLALSFYATLVSTNSFVGFTGKSYTFGFAWLLMGAVIVGCAAVSWLWIAPRFRWRMSTTQAVVPSEFFRVHFESQTIGTIAAIVTLASSTLMLAAVFLGASLSVSALWDLDFAVCLVGVFGFQVAYTAIGGLRADVYTDALQAGLILCAAIALPALLVQDLGGLRQVWTRLHEIDREGAPVFPDSETPWLILLGISLAAGLKLLTDPRQLTRFSALRPSSSRAQGLWVSCSFLTLTYAGLLLVGVLVHARGAPSAVVENTDRIMPYLLTDPSFGGRALRSFLLAAVVFAATSTTDSLLLVAAAVLQKDLLPISPMWRSRMSDSVGVARLLTVCTAFTGFVACYTIWSLDLRAGIVELTTFSGALYAGALLVPLGLALYSPDRSSGPVVIAMLAGAGAVTLWRGTCLVFYDLSPHLDIFVGLGCSVGALRLARWLRARDERP